MVGLWSLETGLSWSFGSHQFRDGEKWQVGGMTKGECRVRDFARRALLEESLRPRKKDLMEGATFGKQLEGRSDLGHMQREEGWAGTNHGSLDAQLRRLGCPGGFNTVLSSSKVCRRLVWW